ncbi:MAG: type II secretion system protein N [Planctomycetota bacterium]
MRIGQAAAVLLAGSAVLAMMFEPGLPPAPVPIANAPTEPTTPEPNDPEAPPFDVSLVAMMLNEAGSVEPAFAVDPTPPEPEEDTSPPISTAPESTSNFRFLGGFFSNNRSLAIIAGGGKQRMVRAGDAIDFGFTVNTITPDFVEIERNGVVERLDREVATGAVVGTAAASASVVQDNRAAPGANANESARERMQRAREQANERAGTDRAKRRADYERQRQQRIEELREQGVDVDELEWRRDN